MKEPPPRLLQLLPLAFAVLLAFSASGCPSLQTPKVVVFSDPLTPEEHARLGSIYQEEGKSELAAREYAAALKKDPHNLVALVGMGNLSLEAGKPGLAARYFSRALKQDPENFAATNNLAVALRLSGRLEKALAAANRAVELSEGRDPRAFHTRAEVFSARGEEEAARRDREAARRLCQKICGTTFQLAPGRGDDPEQEELPACSPSIEETCRGLSPAFKPAAKSGTERNPGPKETSSE